MRAFLELDDPAEQAGFWRRQLDTRRFRAAFDALFSVTALRAVYASPFLAFLPPRLGAVMRARMERCFARHPNRTNPYARALLLGELADDPPRPRAGAIELVHADAADVPRARARRAASTASRCRTSSTAPSPAYRARLFAAVQRAAAPGAIVVLRSFAEPTAALPTNRAADDRSMLWGIVDVRPAAELTPGVAGTARSTATG